MLSLLTSAVGLSTSRPTTRQSHTRSVQYKAHCVDLPAPVCRTIHMSVPCPRVTRALRGLKPQLLLSKAVSTIARPYTRTTDVRSEDFKTQDKKPVTMARPKFAPKSTPFRGPIPKPHYLPHLWTRPTYDAKRHPDPIRRFSTMHWTDRPTDRQIVHWKVWRTGGSASNESDAA